MIDTLFRRLIRSKLPKALTLRRHRLLGDKFSLAEEQRLEKAAAAFLGGLWAAVEEKSFAGLRERLISYGRWERGFAFEGAGMGVSLLEGGVLSGKTLFRELIEKWGRNYVYVIYVGAGWAFARKGVCPDEFLKRLDRVLGWLAVDGYGFYVGLFENTAEQESLNRFAGYAGRVLRQGYGRALWFLARGSVSTISQVIGELPRDWWADVWSGIGVACVYAGDLSVDELVQLRCLAGKAAPALALGAAFAAKARKLAGDLSSDHHESEAQANADYYNIACMVLCGVDALMAAAITDNALDDLPIVEEQPAYDVWRQRVQNAFEHSPVPAPLTRIALVPNALAPIICNVQQDCQADSSL
jgi:hypothetical protein